MSVSISYKHKNLELNSVTLFRGGIALRDGAVSHVEADDNKQGNGRTSINPISINSVSTDTRTLEKGALFVALKGETFDGRAYVELAIEKGAVACVVEENVEGGTGEKDLEHTENQETLENPVFNFEALSIKFPHIYFLKTSSALMTLQEMATQYRNQFSIPVIGVTGSNGKTTTKNLIASVLMQKYKTISTRGNLNNHIGLPLSILSIEPDTEVAVFEAGINHIGEMGLLSSIMQPTSVVVTNIGNAHIEFFGSREVIAKEKAELARSAPSGSPLYIPYNDLFANSIGDFVPHMQTISVHEDFAVIDQLRKNNFKYINTPHVMSDVYLAVAIGRQHNLSTEDISIGIMNAKLETGRFDVRTISGELIVIDDTYNANPDSVCGSITAMHSMYPEHTLVLILGQLKEQGEFLKEGYAKIIATAETERITEVFLVGISADDCVNRRVNNTGIRMHYFSSKQLCLDILTTYIEEKMNTGEKLAILVKGSRSSKMEDVVKGLLSK